VRPRLESWNRRDDPDQVALREFVSHVHDRVDSVIDAIDGALAFRLDVGLEDILDPLWERDLDNYLFPIARSLPSRVVSVWGTKRRGAASFVRIEPAVPVGTSRWQEFRVPRSASGERSWKHAVHEAVQSASELPEGPVAVQLALTVGANRNWPAMWKPSIDALDRLLGRTYRGKEWNPLDGRIVRLGLHKSVDASYGDDASMIVQARPADETWPEMQWLASLDADTRWAFEEQHRAKQRNRFDRPMPAVLSSRRADPALAAIRPQFVPAGVEQFNDDDAGYFAWLAANPGGWVTNIQRSLTASDARLHRADCRTINGEPTHGATWTTAYIKICSTDVAALDAWAVKNIGTPIARCGTCQPPDADAH
jgi:hypothetical protein